jgi:hypothetical protein
MYGGNVLGTHLLSFFSFCGTVLGTHWATLRQSITRPWLISTLLTIFTYAISAEAIHTSVGNDGSQEGSNACGKTILVTCELLSVRMLYLDHKLIAPDCRQGYYNLSRGQGQNPGRLCSHGSGARDLDTRLYGAVRESTASLG